MPKYFIGTLLESQQNDQQIEIATDVADRYGLPYMYDRVVPHITLVGAFEWESAYPNLVLESIRQQVGNFPFGMLERSDLFSYKNKLGYSLAWRYVPKRGAKELIGTICDTVRMHGITVAKENDAVLHSLHSRIIQNVPDIVQFQKAKNYVEREYRLHNSPFRIFSVILFLWDQDRWIIPKGGKLLF